MKGSLIVVGFFALGLLAGRSGCMPTWGSWRAASAWWLYAPCSSS